MPVQKIEIKVTVLAEADTLEEAVSAYSEMTLSQIGHSIDVGDDIGQTEIVSSRTLETSEVTQALLEIGNDGTFFEHLTEDAE